MKRKQNLENRTEQALTIPVVRQRAMTWWNKLPDNNNGEDSKWQLAYKFFDRHWMSLTGREIESIYKRHVA